MEQIFSQYMERRLKAEEVVKKLSKEHLKKHKIRSLATEESETLKSFS